MSSSFVNPSVARGKSNVSADQVQRLLEENCNLIQCIADNQARGKLSECTKYQNQLHRNLVFLATVADSNQSGAPGLMSGTPSTDMGATAVGKTQTSGAGEGKTEPLPASTPQSVAATSIPPSALSSAAHQPPMAGNASQGYIYSHAGMPLTHAPPTSHVPPTSHITSAPHQLDQHQPQPVVVQAPTSQPPASQHQQTLPHQQNLPPPPQQQQQQGLPPSQQPQQALPPQQQALPPPQQHQYPPPPPPGQAGAPIQYPQHQQHRPPMSTYNPQYAAYQQPGAPAPAGGYNDVMHQPKYPSPHQVSYQQPQQYQQPVQYHQPGQHATYPH